MVNVSQDVWGKATNDTLRAVGSNPTVIATNV